MLKLKSEKNIYLQELPNITLSYPGCIPALCPMFLGRAPWMWELVSACFTENSLSNWRFLNDISQSFPTIDPSCHGLWSCKMLALNKSSQNVPLSLWVHFNNVASGFIWTMWPVDSFQECKPVLCSILRGRELLCPCVFVSENVSTVLTQKSTFHLYIHVTDYIVANFYPALSAGWHIFLISCLTYCCLLHTWIGVHAGQRF